MDAEDFIDGIHAFVYHGAIDGTLKNLTRPAGRRPREDLANLSAWFNQLTPEDARQVAAVVRLAAGQSIFDMMAVLDGIQFIDDEHTVLNLDAGSGIRLNERHDLHELFQIRVDHELGYVDEFGRPLDSGDRAPGRRPDGS